MCIVIHKPGGKVLHTDILQQACTNNPDGGGVMFLLGGKVNGYKGYQDVPSMLGHLDALGFMEDGHVAAKGDFFFHFRIATHGDKVPGNCHPFPVSRRDKDLVATHWAADVGMMHNGIIPNSEADPYFGLSDSQVFVRDVLSNPLIINNLHESAALHTLIDKAIGCSRMVILWGNGKLKKFGYWTDARGCYFSNSTYLPQTNYGSHYQASSSAGGANDTTFNMMSKPYIKLHKGCYIEANCADCVYHTNWKCSYFGREAGAWS